MCSYFVHVRLACPWKSYSYGAGTINVSLYFKIFKVKYVIYLYFCRLLSLNDEYQASSIIFLSIVGNFSLMPLLFTPELFLPKIILFACYEVFLIAGLAWHYKTLRMHLIKSLYLLGFVGVLVYEPFVQHWLGLADRYSFLPLMLVSCYSALGVVYFWFTYYRTFLSIRSEIEEPVAKLPKTKKLQKKSAASKKSEDKKTNWSWMFVFHEFVFRSMSY